MVPMARTGAPPARILEKNRGITLSRLMARGYRDAAMIPAFATDEKASTAATVTSIRPQRPTSASATVATGVRSPPSRARTSAETTPTMTAVPTE